MQKQWQKKSGKDKSKHQIARTRTFQGIMAQLREEYPGPSRNQLRKYVAAKIVMAAFAVAENMTKNYTDDEKVQLKTAVVDWMEDYHAKVLDVEQVTRLKSLFLPDDVLQHFSKITESLDEFFICRHRDCGYIGRNTDWAL